MKKSLLFTTAPAALAVLALAAAPQYKALTRIQIGGEVRWDDLYVDSANHRAYVSHNSQVEVIDTTKDTLVGTIKDTPTVHGTAIANDLKKGFITYGPAVPLRAAPTRRPEACSSSTPMTFRKSA